jgi:hypothetical protein
MTKNILLLVFFGLLTLAGCKSDDDLPPLERYQKALAEGMASTETENEVFLGLDLGIPRKAYFDKCTVLNQQKRITMGGGGNAVDYRLTEELPRPATLTFAPDFGDDNKSIKAMTVLFSYDDWSPWNKESHAPQLLQDLYRFLTAEYGKGFMVVPHEQLGSMLVQVKNNRRINAWVKDERFVQVRFTDLTALPEEPLGYRVGI